MQPDWDKLEKDFIDTPNVVIATADCSGDAQSWCGEQGIRGYPSIKLLVDGKYSEYNGAREYSGLKREVERKLNPKPACSLESKDACSKKDRAVLEESEAMSKADRVKKIKDVEQLIKDKKEQAKTLEKEAKELAADLDLIKAGGATVDKVEQLLNDEDMRAHCDARTCVIAFLPHILDDGAKERNNKIKVLDAAMKVTKKDGKNYGYLWSQGGDQFEMEEALGLQFGFPAVIAVNFKKDRFGVHRGTLDKDSITQFLMSLGRGGVPLAPIPKSAKASKQKPWDGKDGQPPAEEDL